MNSTFKIYVGDKTTCGGTVFGGNSSIPRFGTNIKRHALIGDSVTCGIYAGFYKVAVVNNSNFFKVIEVADTENSYSTCPCRAKFISSDMIGVCTSTDNIIQDGVYVWTEIVGSGHSFISLQLNNTITVYTYGRYGEMAGPVSMAGDGILIRLTGEEARKFCRSELYRMGARVFAVNDADIQKIDNHFQTLLKGGSTPINLPIEAGGATKEYGRSIDVYDVSSRNCTTHTINALKAGGTNIFKKSISVFDSLPGVIRYFDTGQESIVVPLTLENYLVGKKQDLSTLVVVEVTHLFKEQYPNFDSTKPIEKSKKMLFHETATTTASALGYLTDISAEGLDGAIGEWFYERTRE